MSRQLELAAAFHRGKEEGRNAERKNTAQRLMAKGFSKAEIAEALDISAEELERLLSAKVIQSIPSSK